MATLNVQTETTEQSPTLEPGVDISQRNQEVEEATLDSRREQETLTVAHDVITESEALQQSVKSGSQERTFEQRSRTGAQQQTLDSGAATTETTLADAANTSKGPESANMLSEQQQLARNVDLLLGKYQALVEGISSIEGSRKTKRNLEYRLKENIESLQQIKDDLPKYNYNNLSTYKARVGELMFYLDHYEQVRQIVVLGGRTSDIHAIIDSKQDARYARRQERQDARYQSKMNDILHDAALTSLWNNDMERYEEYLEAVLNGQVEPSTHPFFTAHRQSFSLIESIDPQLYGTLAPNGNGRIAYSTYCQRDPQRYEAYCRENNIVCAPQSYNRRFGNRFANMMEQIFPERMNRDPRQRQAWSNIGSLLAIGGTIFMGFKALQSLKKDDKGNRNWGGFAGWAAGTLALLNADTVINTIQDAFNWHPAEKSRMLSESFRKYGFPDETARDMVDRYVGAPVATMSALHFIPIYELESQHILEDKNGEFEFNYANYEKYINQLRRTNDQKDQVLKAGKKLDEDKSIGAGLKAFGITTREKLRSLFGSDKKKTLAQTDEVKKGWDNMVERVSSGVNAELHNNGLRIKDPNNVDAIMKEYEEKKDNTNMNELILKWMTGGLLELNDNRGYTLNAMLENDDIDLKKMTIKGFKSGTNEVPFSTYKELFDTYFLTEKIKYKFEGVPAKSNEPFKINSLGQLKFDDKNWYEFFSSDTTVISRKTFTNDFPTLKEYRDDYARYLNERRQGKNVVDISSLDIVSQLGINFYSEQEARELNTTLRRIKDDLRYYYPTKYGDPFEIKDGVLKIKIEFTTVGESKKTWDISGLKTFSSEANKEKLLKYLNDKTNKMWGSSL